MKKIFLVCLLGLSNYQYAESIKALVIKPVIDLVGQATPTITAESVQQFYESMPCSGEQGKWACPRIHQLLANEIVDIVDEHQDEVCIEISNAFFHNGEHLFEQQDRFARYWTLKSNIISLTTLQQKGIDLSLLPISISWKENNIEEANKNIITLTMSCTINNSTYSAGTRFVLYDEHETNYTCWFFDAEQITMRLISISKESSIKFVQKSQQARIADFVQLLRNWCSLQDNKVIPFVWGGCSMRESCDPKAFTFEHGERAGEIISFYVRLLKNRPMSGFDASGLVLRAAQVVGIPYYFKNSLTAAQYLRQLRQDEQVEVGDLIWLPAGLFIISDVMNNKIIAAQGYKFGFGYIHEFQLNNVFKNVSTFHELVEAFLNKTPLERVEYDGRVVSFPTFKLLKIRSAWQTNY